MRPSLLGAQHSTESPRIASHHTQAEKSATWQIELFFDAFFPPPPQLLPAPYKDVGQQQ